MPRNRCQECLLIATKTNQKATDLFQTSTGKAVFGCLLYAGSSGQQADIVSALSLQPSGRENYIRKSASKYRLINFFLLNERFFKFYSALQFSSFIHMISYNPIITLFPPLHLYGPLLPSLSPLVITGLFSIFV